MCCWPIDRSRPNTITNGDIGCQHNYRNVIRIHSKRAIISFLQINWFDLKNLRFYHYNINIFSKFLKAKVWYYLLFTSINCVYLLSIIEKLVVSFPTAILILKFSFHKIFLLNPFFQKQWAAANNFKNVY